MDAKEVEPNPDFGSNLLEQVLELWVLPELERRGLPADPSAVRKALVVLSPGRSPVVTINEQVKLIGTARARSDIAAGDAVTEDDIDEIVQLEPAEIDLNSGWVAYVNYRGKPFIQFDFRYNKQSVAGILDLAADYANAAEACLASLPRPAADNLYSAAELSVHAQMSSINWTTNNHWQRAKWLDAWAKLENVPAYHPTVLDQLYKARPAARYLEGELGLTTNDLAMLLSQVREMITFAALRAGIDEPGTPEIDRTNP